jgi:hypothetical protein
MDAKSEIAQLRSLTEGVPKLVEFESAAFTSKMWITPGGDVVPLEDWHYRYFKDPVVAERWGVTYSDNEQEVRVQALKVGFIRINYERKNGTLTVESFQKGWTKRAKDTIFMLVADNASSIDNIYVRVMNDDGMTVRQGSTQLFRYDDREKLEHIPLISETEQGHRLRDLNILGS